MQIATINSDTVITDIDCHFKVSAGPGAGKTYWLVNHIKNVVHNSEKLFRTGKVACITYTNIAVETILRRLGTASDQVEVSTIHSFFYKNIVKPYASFIADEYGLDIAKMDGHDEIAVSFGKLKEWADTTRQIYLYTDRDSKKATEKQMKVRKALENLQWVIENNDIALKINPQKAYLGKITSNVSIKNTSLINFKEIYWEKGILSHDDVLFFAFRIIKKFPFVLNILSAKFPYIFIDEFQDSNPIQVEIFRKLGEVGSKIGVIGDPAQSIYGFQGADYKQFGTFSLPTIKEYILNENRRSSNEIVDALNAIRSDINQLKVRNISIAKPMIFIGDMIHALRTAKMKCNNEKVQTLSRDNITSNAMKAEISGSELNRHLLENLKEIDSYPIRRNLIYSCIRATAFGKENKFKDAIKELERLFNYKTDKIRGKKKALRFITFLLDKYQEIENMNLYDFAVLIRNELVSDLPNLRTGSIKSFYETYTVKQLLLCVSIPEDMSLHKTIHKAKGDEFDNVLLVLKEEKDLNFLLDHNLLLGNEEYRINYVAASRARNRLFISVPTLSPRTQAALQLSYDFENV